MGASNWRSHLQSYVGPPIGDLTSNWRSHLWFEVSPLIGGPISNWRCHLQSEVPPPGGFFSCHLGWSQYLITSRISKALISSQIYSPCTVCPVLEEAYLHLLFICSTVLAKYIYHCTARNELFTNWLHILQFPSLPSRPNDSSLVPPDGSITLRYILLWHQINGRLWRTVNFTIIGAQGFWTITSTWVWFTLYQGYTHPNTNCPWWYWQIWFHILHQVSLTTTKSISPCSVWLHMGWTPHITLGYLIWHGYLCGWLSWVDVGHLL